MFYKLCLGLFEIYQMLVRHLGPVRRFNQSATQFQKQFRVCLTDVAFRDLYICCQLRMFQEDTRYQFKSHV